MQAFLKRLLTLICGMGLFPAISFAQMQAQESGSKSWLFSTGLSRATIGRYEVNLKNQGSIAIEGGYMGANEQLRQDEIEQSPGDSLITYGREYKIMISRFSQGNKMAGFYWGLGVGQRHLEADWRKSPDARENVPFGVTDEDGKTNHRLDIKGTLVEGRLGYRYVADAGFLAGIFIDVAHHNNKVTDRDSVVDSKEGDYISQVSEREASILSRRVTSTPAPGLEFGWAF